MMNREIKDKWVTALRSGDYTQGYGRLRYQNGDGERHCCLGVLCDLAVEAGVIPAPTTDEKGEYGYPVTNADGIHVYDEKGVLPPDVVSWADLPSSNPRVPGFSLSGANDNGQTFDQIADLIENNL